MAASSAVTSLFYCRGSDGLWRVKGTKTPYDRDSSFNGDASKDCKCLEFSADGSRVAWHNGAALLIYDVTADKVLHTIECKPVTYLCFSPKAAILAAWHPYSTGKDKTPSPNLHIFDVQTGQEVACFYQKKAQYWQPQWSIDEKVCARNVNNELQFYENNNFSEIKTKLHLQKVSQFSMAMNNAPYSVAAYVPGTKGMPSNIRVYKYPNFGGHSAAVASKSFFKADRVNLDWNSLGTAMLVLTSTESSDSSYYGEQGLHFLALNGDSCVVPLAKNGPVYNTAWHPSGTEFTVLYGYMPAKCTVFNMKNDPVFDFGTGPRNQLFYNCFGNILCLAGFGNLQGNLEFWDMAQKKLISSVSAKDATCFMWSPDGQHALTATLSPRMRVGNGYKIWHYTGSLMKHVNLDANSELWQVGWGPTQPDTYSAPVISYKALPTEEKAPPTNSAKAYRPPGMRGREPVTKIHEFELPSNQKKAAETEKQQLSKNQKRKLAKQSAAAAAQTSDDTSNATSAVKQSQVVSQAAPSKAAKAQAPQSQTGPPQGQAATPHYVALTGDPEKDKKIKNLSKKLQAIQKLKDEQAAGKTLQTNQLEKLKKEDEIIDELENISLS